MYLFNLRRGGRRAGGPEPLVNDNGIDDDLAEQPNFNFIPPPLPPLAPHRRIVTEVGGRLCISISSSNSSTENLASIGNNNNDFGGANGAGAVATTTNNGGYQMEEEPGELQLLPSSRSNSLVSVESLQSARALALTDTVLLAEELELRYQFCRVQALRDELFNTPLAALYDLATDFDAQPKYQHREIKGLGCKRFVGEAVAGKLRGYGEASSIKLAYHMAAVNLLMNLQGTTSIEIHPYYLMPGCRINPAIFSHLEALCCLLELKKPTYILIPKDPEEEDGPLFTLKCQIGRLICIGYSDSFCLARRWAAKKAFEALTGETIPMDFVSLGAPCLQTAKSAGFELPFKSENQDPSDFDELVPIMSSREFLGFDDMVDDVSDVDVESTEKMSHLIKSMTHEVKEKLIGLRIQDDDETAMDGN